MYERVYFYKVSRCMEFLLDKVFKRASILSDEVTQLSKVIDINTKTTPELLYKMDDNSCVGLFHEWSKSDDDILKDLAIRVLERRRLASITLSIKQYTDLGTIRLSQLPQTVESKGFSKDYYFIEDSYEKTAYDVYNPEEFEDGGFTSIGHIMTPNENGTLNEISNKSPIIQALSQNYVKKIRIFIPEDVLPEVKQIVSI